MGMRSPVAGGARGGDAGRLADPLVGANGVKDECWVPADEEEMLPAHGEDGQRPLLFRTFKVKATVLYLYRLMSLARMIATILFVIWRMKHPDSDAMWLWWFTIFGDFWFGVSWLINQVPKHNPIKCIPNLSHLRKQFDLPNGSSILPGLDVFINTVDPVDEPMIYTMNSVLSILATDYPVERHAIYFSDDGGSLVHYEGLLETAKFAALWVPFCRKHCVEPRAPERYFMMKTHPYIGKQHDEFLDDHRRVRRDYEEFKVRLDALFTIIPQRSEVYNRANTKEGGANATWMENGTWWPGTWIEPTEDHSKGHHAEIIQVLLNHPGNEPELGMPSSSDNPLDFSSVDMRLPMLVYMAREKHPCYDHQKKAGAMNVQLRVSALLSNAPFIINFDGDHYVNNSQAFRAAMCFFLDRRDSAGDTAFVQFPQRFDDVDPTDRYCNHNRVFFDATLLGLNGIQGPSYVGTGCMFRRVALYGADPPRWRPDDGKVLDRRPSKFGKSIPFLKSMLVAAVDQERSITSVTIDGKLMSELFDVMACTYEDGTEWGGSVGWVYNVATEDLATGLRLHGAGWRSTYYAMDPDAFRGTAPINLTERLYQILRWSGGSMEVFFSGLCPLLAGRRLMPVQRVAYTNMTAYPISALLIFAYGLFPAMWLSHGMFYIQKPFLTYVLYVVGIIAMTEVIGMVEIRWAGLTVRDWFRNEQFYIIGATGVYPTAVLHVLLRSLGMQGVSFKLTAKQLATSARERFTAVQWAPLLAPTAVVMVVNAAAIGVAIGKAVAGGWSAEKVGDAAAGLVFNVWILLLLYPFALGVTGRWSRRPYVLFAMWWARLPLPQKRHSLIGTKQQLPTGFELVSNLPSVEVELLLPGPGPVSKDSTPLTGPQNPSAESSSALSRLDLQTT